MKKDINCIALFTKHNNNESKKVSMILKEKMLEKGIKVIDYMPERNSFSDGSVKDEIDLAIAIGGDGTTLRTFRSLPNDVPVLSVNAGGTRGILSEISKDSVVSVIPLLLQGEYYLDKRIRLMVKVGNESLCPALNDFVLIRADLTKTPTFNISLQNNSLTQKMDGLVISTPTGSTGHSLSNGGPIIHENLECLLITPIASVNRLPPFVIPVEELNILVNYDINLVVDGQNNFKIPKDQKITVIKYEHYGNFLRFNKNKLRQLTKLGY